MAILRFRYAAKVELVFGTGDLTYIRQIEETQNLTINFSDGSGQTLTAGQVLSTIGTQGTDGYLHISATNNTTFSGSGNFEVTVTHQPTETQPNQVTSFQIDGSTVNINLYYNSRPEANDVVIDKPNSQIHIFKPIDFIFSDYDNDTITEVAIFGNVTGYEYNGIAYAEGTWVSFADLDLDLLQYIPLDQETAYDKDNTYKVKDSNGNISD